MEETGKIKWYNPDKGYGFIVPDRGGKDIFLHHSEVRASGEEFDVGDAVQYTVSEHKGRNSAVNLKRI